MNHGPLPHFRIEVARFQEGELDYSPISEEIGAGGTSVKTMFEGKWIDIPLFGG